MKCPLVFITLVSSVVAQQFEIALPLDPLDQKPLEFSRHCTGGDVDGDGRTDLLAAGPRLWLNRGSHFVAAASGLPATPAAAQPTLFDADGDGDLDIIEGDSFSRLLLNQGNGTFVDVTATHLPPQAFSVGRTYPADIEGDGDLDVLLPLGKVFVNNGLGVFTDETATRVLGSSMSISQAMAVADFDQDGDVDFATGVGLHRNDGTGVFQFDATANITFSYQEHVFVADFDCDGHLDVATSEARFLRNLGNGTFQAGPNLVPSTPAYVVVGAADFDGDGRVDVLLSPDSTAFGDRPMWCANDGTGSFAAANFRPLPLLMDEIGITRPIDLDGDGDLDLAAAKMNSYVPSPIELLYNDGAGAWHRATDLVWPSRVFTWGHLAADFDGDHDADVFNTAGIHFNDGDGTFRFVLHGVTTLIVPAGGPADLDSDGDVDIVSTAGVIWRNTGNGTFTNGGALLASPMQARDFTTVDVDGDGDLDLVLVTNSDVRVYRNDGGGVSTLLPGVLPAGLVATAVASGDFDGDSDADLVFGIYNVSPFAQSVVLFTNAGGGVFTAAAMPAVGLTITKLHVIDLEGDGDLDMVLERSGHYTMLVVNDGTATFTAVMLPMTGHLGLDDMDGDRDVDVFAIGPEQGPAWLVLHVNDGANNFTPEPLRLDPARTMDRASDFVLVDFEGDGDRDVMAIAFNTGTQFLYPVPYWNHQRQLRAANLTTLGGALEIELATTGAANPAAIAFVCIAASPAHVPLGELGVLGVDPATGFVDARVLSPGTPTLASYAIPQVNALRGLPLHAQALFVSSTQWRLSGTVANTIVH